MAILLADPVVHAVRVRDNGDPLIPLAFAPGVLVRARLAGRLTEARAASLVNYPTEWWHWSYGDRYWALLTDAEHAIYGPVEAGVPA